MLTAASGARLRERVLAALAEALPVEEGDEWFLVPLAWWRDLRAACGLLEPLASPHERAALPPVPTHLLLASDAPCDVVCLADAPRPFHPIARERLAETGAAAVPGSLWHELKAMFGCEGPPLPRRAKASTSGAISLDTFPRLLRVRWGGSPASQPSEALFVCGSAGAAEVRNGIALHMGLQPHELALADAHTRARVTLPQTSNDAPLVASHRALLRGEALPVACMVQEAEVLGAAASSSAPRRGLVNVGNSCYLASVVQALASVPGLASSCRAVAARLAERAQDATSPAAWRARTRIVQELSSLLSALSEPAAIAASPAALVAAVADKDAAFREARQHDAHEFLLFLLEELHAAAGAADSPVARALEGQTTSTVRCAVCGAVSATSDSFRCLSLSLGDSAADGAGTLASLTLHGLGRAPVPVALDQVHAGATLLHLIASAANAAGEAGRRSGALAAGKLALLVVEGAPAGPSDLPSWTLLDVADVVRDRAHKLAQARRWRSASAAIFFAPFAPCDDAEARQLARVSLSPAEALARGDARERLVRLALRAPAELLGRLSVFRDQVAAAAAVESTGGDVASAASAAASIEGATAFPCCSDPLFACRGRHTPETASHASTTLQLLARGFVGRVAAAPPPLVVLHAFRAADGVRFCGAEFGWAFAPTLEAFGPRVDVAAIATRCARAAGARSLPVEALLLPPSPQPASLAWARAIDLCAPLCAAPETLWEAEASRGRAAIVFVWSDDALRASAQPSAPARGDAGLCGTEAAAAGAKAAGGRRPHLDSLMRQYSRCEPLADAWLCPRCLVKRPALKAVAPSRLPPCLAIHLKRFRVERGSVLKLADEVELPLEAWRPHGARGASYDLVAVVQHHGLAGFGHYTCVARAGSQWFEFDDERVAPVDACRARSAAAYLLLYARRAT